MGLSNAERQRRWRVRREALVRANPEVLERALLKEAEQCEGMSGEERTALTDKLANVALDHLRRSQELAAIARRVRGVER